MSDFNTSKFNTGDHHDPSEEGTDILRRSKR